MSLHEERPRRGVLSNIIWWDEWKSIWSLKIDSKKLQTVEEGAFTAEEEENSEKNLENNQKVRYYTKKVTIQSCSTKKMFWSFKSFPIFFM